MDIVTYALSKKLVNGIQSGLASATVDNDNCSITFNWTNGTSSTMTFPKPANGVSITNAEIVNDELILTFSDSTTINAGNVKGDKGDTGDKGEKGDKGEQGIQGEKGEDGVNPTIEIATQSDTEYTLKLTDADGSIITPNLQGIGSAIFVGTEITSNQSGIVVEITDSHIGDMYINVDTSDYYIRDDANSINNSWCYKGNLQGIQGMNNYELAVKNGFIGTEQDYLDSLVGETNDTHIVSSKPNIADDTTELKTWYYYQVDGNGSNTAWKYKMYLPTTADLTAGKYAVYYSMKPYRGEFTVDTPAMTDKDTYRYYVIMDLNAITTTIYKEAIADGTTEVLETVQCEQKEPTDEYIIIDEPMEQLGQWVQTLWIGSTKEDASEVTLKTGVSVTGFISTLTFEEIVGNRSDLLTVDKSSIVNAINEHDKLLRDSNADVLNTTSKNIVGAINELESKHYLDVFDLQGGSVLDYAKTFGALTHNYFYANNCADLPNNMNYGYCAVDVSQDPLYRDITFYCPTSGRIYVNTIGASADLTGFGEWSGWHEFLMKKDIVTTLDDTVTNEQIPSAKALYDEIKKGRIIFTDLPQGTDILAWADSLPDENFSQVYFCRAFNCVNKPPNVTDGFIMVRRITNEKWIGLTWYDIRSTQTFERRKLNDVWGEWSVISPIKEGYVRNSNGGGVSYYKQIKDMVIVTCSNVSRLIYTWNIGASINEGGALPKPIIKIPVSIMSSNGEFYLAELDTDGYIKVKNRNIPATEDGNIYYYSFNYITDEL